MIKTFKDFKLYEDSSEVLKPSSWLELNPIDDSAIDVYTPSIFGHTIYRLPNPDEIKEFGNADLTVDKFINGLHYTMVGRGIIDDEIKNQIVTAAKMISDAYPNNEIYKEGLKQVSIKYNI